MRLDKFIAGQLAISRASAGKHLRAGSVTIDGTPVKDGAFRLQPHHSVACQGTPLPQIHGKRYFMLNKPAGYVCAADDPHNPGILQLIHEPLAHQLHSVGRLDLDATGLLLITDDGQWSHRVTSPRRHCQKTYHLTLAGPLAADSVSRFAAGITLRNDLTPTRPATLHLIGEREARITISEGRYHQIKRMIAATGNRVLTLHRERIASIALDPALPPGAYRPLTAAEIASIP